MGSNWEKTLGRDTYVVGWPAGTDEAAHDGRARGRSGHDRSQAHALATIRTVPAFEVEDPPEQLGPAQRIVPSSVHADSFPPFHQLQGETFCFLGFRRRAHLRHDFGAPRRVVDLGGKQTYSPDEAKAAVYTHAQHFVATVKSIVQRHHERTGRHRVVVAPFDAELFGHRWHEGPLFIKEVMLALHNGATVKAQTFSQHLSAWPADKVEGLPAGSWGAKGDFSVWLNDETRWTWEAAHGAEDRLLDALHRHDWRGSPGIAEPLRAAARELLLLQASDWQFVIHTRGAVDYGYRRFCEHLARFDRACTIADARAAGKPDSALTVIELADMAGHDDCFAGLNLDWWM